MKDLTATFGLCATCGAPCTVLRTTLPGSETPYIKMVCTSDMTHDDPMDGIR